MEGLTAEVGPQALLIERLNTILRKGGIAELTALHVPNDFQETFDHAKFSRPLHKSTANPVSDFLRTRLPEFGRGMHCASMAIFQRL